MTALPGKTIECNVMQGTLADAKWHSCGVNKAHGLRRSNADKQRAVREALAHRNGMELSDGAIAHYVGVSSGLVGKIRKLSAVDYGDDLPRTRTGRDGRTINTANIGQSRLKRLEIKLGKNGARSSQKVLYPVRGHSLPSSMVPLRLPCRNAVMAAAIICTQFDSDFVRALIAELTQRLPGVNNHANN